MTFRQLEYLVALDRYKQFASAAEACKISQPSLSATIKHLEEELGVVLFDRTDPLRPTAIGVRIIDQAKKILGRMAEMSDIIREERHELGGSVTVAVLPTIAPFLLPAFIPEWRKKTPNLKTEIIELTSDQCLNALRDRSVDMALMATKPGMDGVERRPLYYEKFLYYTAPSEPHAAYPHITPSLVDVEHLWLLSDGHCFRDQMVRFCHLKRNQKGALTYTQGNLLSLMHLVESNQGCTFIPELALSFLSPEQKKLVRPFSEPCPVREIQLVYRSDYARRSLLQTFTQAVRSVIPPHMHALSPDTILL